MDIQNSCSRNFLFAIFYSLFSVLRFSIRVLKNRIEFETRTTYRLQANLRIVFFFIDGLGIGKNDFAINPCAHQGIRVFNNFETDTFPKKILLNGLVKPIDACLDVEGLPQSATGQTALFTGINASRTVGMHLSGFPNGKLRTLLESHSILRQVKELGKKPAFINVYRPIFFEMGPEKLLRYLSVTSVANWKAGLKFFDFTDLRAERALYHDFTNQELLRKGFNVPEFSPENAGKILSRSSLQFDFCLYEFFKTDVAGHTQQMPRAVNLLLVLERFLFSFLENTDLSNTTVVLTSDHGNIEDLSLKTHTKNNVPLMVWGPGREILLPRIHSLLDVTPTLIKYLTGN